MFDFIVYIFTDFKIYIFLCRRKCTKFEFFLSSAYAQIHRKYYKFCLSHWTYCWQYLNVCWSIYQHNLIRPNIRENIHKACKCLRAYMELCLFVYLSNAYKKISIPVSLSTYLHFNLSTETQYRERKKAKKGIIFLHLCCKQRVTKWCTHAFRKFCPSGAFFMPEADLLILNAAYHQRLLSFNCQV